MTAVAIPFDLARIRGAVERLGLRDLDLRSIDLSDLDVLRRDLGRRVADADLQRDLQRRLEDLDLPAVDLPDLDGLLRRRSRGGPFAISGGSLFVGTLALLGGLALGGLIAFFLHPSKGAGRRRQLVRRVGRVKRRLLG